MIKINLLETTREKESRTPILRAAPPVSSMIIIGVVVVVAAALIVGIWYWQVWGDLKTSRIALEDAKREKEVLKPFIEEVVKYEKRKILWAAKRDAIDILRKNRNMPVHLLDEITKSLPQFLWLESADYKGATITFKGSCTNKLDPSTLVANLEASDYFAEVKLTSVVLKPETTGGESYQFAIITNVVNPFQQKAQTDAESKTKSTT